MSNEGNQLVKIKQGDLKATIVEESLPVWEDRGWSRDEDVPENQQPATPPQTDAQDAQVSQLASSTSTDRGSAPTPTDAATDTGTGTDTLSATPAPGDATA